MNPPTDRPIPPPFESVEIFPPLIPDAYSHQLRVRQEDINVPPQLPLDSSRLLLSYQELPRRR